ncbi:hypothetical protein [Gelidibacter salicanalis]|uniref:hypothetical protein n=1 Tax=Gelidibacter salicanalis TaxID=291193 RepID=UPI0011BEA65A|nr:hypothetical protein [Gelidibacter salicanalis]
MAGFYSFFLIGHYLNLILKYASIVILLYGVYYLIAQSFLKPKSIGILEIANDAIHVKLGDITKIIPVNQLEAIVLKYSSFGSWSAHSIYGNKNFLQIIDKDDHTYDLEILLKNRSSKNIFKRLMNVDELSEKFHWSKMKQSNSEF